jgi:hypothetical protein
MNKLWKLTVACVAPCGCLMLGGCDDSATVPSAPRTAPAQTSAPANPAPATGIPAVDQQPIGTPAQVASEPVGAPTTGVDRQKAEAGVGKKGRGYGGGIITEPVHQYFVGKDRITFEIEIPQNMKLFQAEHNRFPKDFAEFKRAILDPSQITLPELPAGDHYVYDPKEHELMVEHPAPDNGAE